MTPDLAELQGTWEELLSQEEAQFNLCVELDQKTAGERSKEKSEAVRLWWGLANSILWMMVRARAQHGHELLPYPALTLGRLANVSEELSTGNIPSFVLDAKKRGRGMWRQERHHIAKAVFYLLAVEEGIVDDKHPTKTVRVSYNVTSQAVRNWKRKRDSICVGVPKATSADDIVAEMLEAGKIYARIGRGAPSE